MVLYIDSFDVKLTKVKPLSKIGHGNCVVVCGFFKDLAKNFISALALLYFKVQREKMRQPLKRQQNLFSG